MQHDASAEAAVRDRERRVLVLPATQADGLAMAKVLGANQIIVTVCATMTQVCDTQADGAGALILCEEAVLADGEELVACVARQAVWSDLPILVLSRSGHEALALSDLVDRLGNVSVVERPIRTSTLVWLVRSCLRARERQYQVRDHLSQQEKAQQAVRDSVEAERAARGEAERASHLKDEFLAILSHELRTPLNAVLGWTQLLRKSPELSQDAINALTVIERNARAQAQIINDLLDMSSIISGKVHLNVQPVDLARMIETTLETVRPTAETKNVRFQALLDRTAGAVRGDPNRLQQVLWNLLANAVKFSRKDSLIFVTLTRMHSHVAIEVRDNGEGINAEFLPHIFDRFRQADPSSTRRHGGLGLGLSIAKQLVELHGGTIAAESAGRNLGATFRISLPLATATNNPLDSLYAPYLSRSAEQVTLQDSPSIDLSGLRILVVDDELDARTLIQRLLQDCNAVVTTAASADEAIGVMLRDSPDVLISDIGMPSADGYSLIRRIRSMSDAHSSIPAIALTAYARLEDRTKAIQAGFQSHLAKPVEPNELVSTIRTLVPRPSGLPESGRDSPH